MATIDLSRHATDFRKHYAGVRMQQGRVLTDDDFNEHARLDAEDIRRTRIDTIGPVGSPDDGFLITNPVIDTTTNRPTFTIKAGTFYLGGQRLTLEADELYHLQKDWLQNGASTSDPILATPTGPRYDFAWLETWQQPVSAIEDSELLEVALGGPDTSARIRNLRRVRVLPDVASEDCNDSWTALLASLSTEGTLNSEFELVPDAKLRIEPDGTSGTADLCSPPVAGGYLGAENQAIRVQIVGTNQFTWGFDNAAPLYRVQLGVDAGAQRRRITMVTLPKDTAHWPLVGQTVELLPWSAVLANGQKIASTRGHLAKVTASYDSDKKYFDIDVVPPDDASGHLFGETWKDRTGPSGDASTLDDEGEFFYLRVWNRGSDTASAAKISFTAGTPVSLTHTGLRVTFSGTQLRTDDFWIIAARPDAPNTVVPWELSTNRRPHGIRRWIAPLAVISWPGATAAGEVVNDCRETFLPLTRIRNCCTVTVGDGNESHGNFTSIQAAIESLPDKGGRVCVLPGKYQETIKLINLHDIEISGCGPRTRIIGVPAAKDTDPADPVISIIGGSNFRLEDFAVEAADTGVGIDLLGINPFSKAAQVAETELVNVTLEGLSVSAGQRSALRARFVRELNVHCCELSNQDRACLDPTVLLLADDALFERNVVSVTAGDNAGIYGTESAAGGNAHGGIQIEGTSERVVVRDNLIRGGSDHGIVLGSVREVTDPNDTGPGDNNDGGWGPINICDPTNDFTVTVELPAGSSTRIISTGPLQDIKIVGNRILDHGGCGIGVARFWNLDGADEFIEVLNLTIEDNEIRHCLLRTILEPSISLAAMTGYGGIALASVEQLIIHDNVIVENGAGPAEPVCGIFVLHGEGIDIARNRILENGNGPDDSGGNAGGGNNPTPKRGFRGGIAIAYALAPTRLMAIDKFGSLPGQAPMQTGEPAAKIHENIVSTPAGQALLMVALGPVSIEGNEFTTRGLVTKGPSAGFLAAAVSIMNLGLSNEIMLQYLAYGFFGKNQSIDPMGSLNPAKLDDFKLGRVMANGQVLFSDNQVNLDLLGVGSEFSVSSILIITLDDVGFHDNQCEANLYLFNDIILSHALIFGMSTRMTGNRFKEGFLSAFFSAVTLAFFANTTSLNQGTHCFLPLCFVPANLVRDGNTAIIGPNPLLTLFSKGITCDTLEKLMGAAMNGQDQQAAPAAPATASAAGNAPSPGVQEIAQPNQ
jgi:hypothetical protein